MFENEQKSKKAEKYFHNIKKTKEGRNLFYKKILKSNGYQEFFGDDFCLE